MYRRKGSKSPSECNPGTNSLDAPSRSLATLPIRDIIRMLATTYGLSVTSTPTLLIGELIGPPAAKLLNVLRLRLFPVVAVGLPHQRRYAPGFSLPVLIATLASDPPALP